MRKLSMSVEQKALREIYSEKMWIPLIIPYGLFLWYCILEMVSGFQIEILMFWGMFFLLFVPFLSIVWIVMQKAAQPEKNIRIVKTLLLDYWRFLSPIVFIFFVYSLACGGIYIFALELCMTMAVSVFFAVLYEIGYRLTKSALLPLCFLVAYTLNSAVPIVVGTEKFSFFMMLFQSKLRFMTILIYALLAAIGFILCKKTE